MAEVTFPTEVGGDGTTISDDANPQTGLANGGHRTRFIKALQQLVAVASFVVARVQDVASLALNILNAPAVSATSTSSLTLAASGTIAFTLDQMNKAFMAGMTVGFARQSAPEQQMVVLLTTFDPPTGQGTGIIASATTTGGPYSGWNVFRTASGGIPATRSFTFNFGDSLIGAGTLAADIVINLGRAVAADIAAGVDNLKAVTAKALKDALAPLTLTDQATIAWDWGLREVAKVTLGGNRNLGKPTNYKIGDTKYLWVYQDATGGRTLALHASFSPGAKPPLSISTGAGKLTIVTVVCVDDDATNPVFRYSYDLDAA